MSRHFSKEDIKMANKHMAVCTSSLVIGVICWLKQIKTVKYNSIPTRMAEIQKVDTPSVDKDVEQPMLSHIAGENIKWYTHFG